jgi:hypothetical protein
MEQSRDPYKKQYRQITIKTTDGATLSGKVNIGIKERLSDLFTKDEGKFVILFGVEQLGAPGKVFFINKRHIVWAEPEEEQIE